MFCCSGCWLSPHRRRDDLQVEAFLLPGNSVNTSRIAVRFTNLSSHELALPTDNFRYPEGIPLDGGPAKGLYFPRTIFSCYPQPGLIAFHYSFVAANAEVVTQCRNAGVAVTKPPVDIVNRAKAWTMLSPGASTTREIPINRVLPIQQGTFRNVRAVYCSPNFSTEDQGKLDKAGIQVPTGNYIASAGFSFETDGESLEHFR
jgi:hypothetical protein